MASTIPNRLARLNALRPPAAAPQAPPLGPAGESITTEPEIAACANWVAQILGGQVRRNRFGEYVSVQRWFPEPGEVAADASALRLLSPESPEAVADPRQWLFLDTETTGLAGGTGTYAFLVGIAWWEAGGIQIEQLFMRDLDEEWPLLAALAEKMEQRPVLVTFNGKSFDWPLLETRFRMTRTIDPPEVRAHLDLLHPARNLWRLRLGSVRLGELERQVLGWDRGADVSSALIPQIYLDFLRGASPGPLVPVLEHNQKDLRGLAAVACRVLSILADGDWSGRDALELYGVSRMCERRGELTRARKLYERSIASSLPAGADRVARQSLARLAKRGGDRLLALNVWEGMLGTSREGLEAYEQLAIHYEHHARDLARASDLTRQALAQLRRSQRLGTIAACAYRQEMARFEHRLARLERKTRRPLLDGLPATGL